MDQLPQERQDQLIAALDRGRLPRLLRSHRYVLDLGDGRNGARAILVDSNGATPEGDFVYDLLGLELPQDLKFDQFQQPTRRGPNEYAKTGQGQEVRIRSLEADGRTWKYTSAGRQFFAIPRSQCTIQIPVTVHGINDQNVEYNRGEDFMLINNSRVRNLDTILLDQNLTTDQKKQRVKEEVKRALGITNTPIVLQAGLSNDEERYDPAREHAWRIDIMTTTPSAQGPRVSVVLNQPMGVLHNTFTIPYPQQVLDICFQKHEDKLCVPRALAELLSMPMELIAESLDYTTESRR